MIDLSKAVFHTDPYPYGIAENVFEPGLYKQLVDTWPTENLYKYMGGGYHKYSLSERNNPAFYHRFIADTEPWREVHHYIKSVKFISDVILKTADYIPLASVGKEWRSRFEFSSLPIDGGFLLPHTDIPSKVITLVIPMFHGVSCVGFNPEIQTCLCDLPHAWYPHWGGGTDILRPKDPNAQHKDYQTPLDQFDIAATAPYVPNNCLIFIKSEKSWHSVGPIAGKGVKGYRRSITINIERVQ